MKILRIQCQKSDFVAIEEPDAADREQMTQIRERVHRYKKSQNHR